MTFPLSSAVQSLHLKRLSRRALLETSYQEMRGGSIGSRPMQIPAEVSAETVIDQPADPHCSRANVGGVEKAEPSAPSKRYV